MILLNIFKYHPYIFLNDGYIVYLPPLEETIPIDKDQIGNTEYYSLGDINGDEVVESDIQKNLKIIL